MPKLLSLMSVAIFILAGHLPCLGQPGKQIMNLDELVREALQSNPEILASGKNSVVFSEKIEQAYALDDPMLGFGVVNLPTDFSFQNEDMTMKEISLSQKFPFPGKRPLLKEAAEKEAEAASAEAEETINRVIKDVKSAYFDLSHVYRAAAVTRKNKEILENFVKIAEARYKLGRGLQQDLLKAHLEVSKMVDELLMLDQQKLAIEARLAGLLNRPPGAPMGQPDEVGFRKVSIVLEDLQHAAIEANPALKAIRKMIESKQSSHRLAGMAYYPDFNVRFSYGQRDDKPDMERRDLLTAMIEVNLPIFFKSKQDRKVLETIAEIQTAEARYNAAKNEILYMTASMVSMVRREERKLELYRTGIIPQATMQTNSALSAYTVNSVDFLTLLDSQMTLLRYELEYHLALTEYEKNLANLEWVVGKSLF